MGMITGLGRVSLLSGWIRRYRVRLGVIGSNPLRYVGAHPADRWDTALASWAVRAARGRRPAGPRLGFGPN
jgi:hypothetical protein